MVAALRSATAVRIDAAAILRRFQMSFLRELFAFIRARRKFWLIPIFAVMLVLGGLLVLTKGSALAPFVYTLF